MTHEELLNLVNRSLFADLGYLDAEGHPAIRRVFCVWHRGLGRHLISTNTSSGHVARLREDDRACLYFSDSERFEGLCLTGRCLARREREFRELLWNDGDEKYYPQGIDDEDYCVLEFVADRGSYYRYDGKGTLTREELAATDAAGVYRNGCLQSTADPNGDNAHGV